MTDRGFRWVIIAIGLACFVFFGFLAPCSWLGWMPLKDLPARCLP